MSELIRRWQLQVHVANKYIKCHYCTDNHFAAIILGFNNYFNIVQESLLTQVKFSVSGRHREKTLEHMTCADRDAEG